MLDNYTWDKGLSGQCVRLLENGKDTGISIVQIQRVITPFIIESGEKGFKLEHPVYSVSFYYNDEVSHILDSPTIDEAKRLGEWFYDEWVRFRSSNYITVT